MGVDAFKVPQKMIRRARITDLDALCSIENACFEGDRLSRRAMRYMLKNPAALLLVAEDSGTLQAYTLTLSYKHHTLARHYSVAVLPEHRGQKLAEKLLLEAEKKCSKPGCKLEIRKDNEAGMRLYERLGYQLTGEKPGYYEDGQTAYQMVKML